MVSVSDADNEYYDAQTQNVNNTAASALAENANAKQGANLTYQQKIAALDEKLGQQQAALPDKFAARGIMNSGIYSEGSAAGHGGTYSGSGPGGFGYQTIAPGNQAGALAQFKHDSNIQQQDLLNLQSNVDQGYAAKVNTINQAQQDQDNQIQATKTAQEAVDAQNSAITAGSGA